MKGARSQRENSGPGQVARTVRCLKVSAGLRAPVADDKTSPALCPQPLPVPFAVPARRSKKALLPRLLGRKAVICLLGEKIGKACKGLTGAWRRAGVPLENVFVVVNISLPGQSEEGIVEQENLTPLPTDAGTALAEPPRPAGSSMPNDPILTFLSSCCKPDPPPEEETEDKVGYKGALGLLLLPLMFCLPPSEVG